MPSAATWASSSTCGTVLSGPLGTPSASSLRRPVVAALVLHDVGDHAEQQVAMLHALDVGLEARLVGPFGMAQRLGELAPQPVVAGADHQRPVAALERLVGRQRGMAGALARRHLAGHRVGRDVVGGPHQPALEQRGVDQAALAGGGALGDGRQHADRRPHAGRQVDDGDADARLRPGRIAVQRDQPGDGLDDRLVARPLLPRAGVAEGAEIGIDQPRESAW